MSSRSVVRLLPLLALILPGCVGRPAYNPWLVPRDSFLARTGTIALSPIRVPEDLEEPEPVEAMFDSLITTALRMAGFSVVPSDIVSEIWNQGADSIGGYYDPMTGRPDTTRLNPLRRYFRQRLRDEHGAHAVLFPEIVVVDAPYAGGSAKWDGASQAVASFLRIVATAIMDADLPEGTAEGLSLDVQLESVEGGAVFNHRGGIELWAKPNGDGSRMDWVPREELFRDRERCAKAVRIALGTVVQREGGTPR